LLGAERMRVLIDTLKRKFDFLVVDSPPVIPFSDARHLALVSDAVILVSRYGFTTRRALTAGAQLFGEGRTPVVGVVLNDIDVKSPDFHYYNYGFSRGMIDYAVDSPTGPSSHIPVRASEGAESSTKAGEAAPANSDSDDKSKGAHA